jgi:hypothetical protein
MENNENVKQDCGCGSNSGDNSCCQPPKSKCWMKILFAVIILAVVVIVTMKLTQKYSTPLPVNKDTTCVQHQGCCDTSKTVSSNGFEPVEIKPCCQKTNK